MVFGLRGSVTLSELWPRRSQPLSVAGIGLLALDLVEAPGAPIQVSAGGSCANVILGLSFLGWKSHVVGRLREDAAGREVRADCARWSVDTTLIALEPLAATPVIRHIIADKDGKRSHRFSLRCQRCGKWLPTYSAVSRQAVGAESKAAKLMSSIDVLYIDRPSPSAATLAQHAAVAGAMIVFEPSGEGSAAAFRTIAGLSHVIKYSREQGSRWPLLGVSTPLVEVETMGADGLRYRTRNAREERAGKWRSLEAVLASALRDAAGAGDWTTVGIIQVLGNAWSGKPFDRATLVTALRCGQALAAWTCAFEGARGGMRVDDAIAVKRRVSTMLKPSTRLLRMSAGGESHALAQTAADFCSACV